MSAGSRGIVLAVVAVVALAAPGSFAGSATSPCPGDAVLCTTTVGVTASCNSIEVYANSAPPVLIAQSAASITGTAGYDYHTAEAAHVPITLATPPGSPIPASLAVSATGLRTACGAYRDTNNGMKRGCVKTEVASFFFNLNLPGTSMDVTIRGEGIVSEQCSSALGGILPGTHAFRAARLAVNSTSIDVAGGLATNQMFGVPGAFVAFNEDFQATTGTCVQNEGDILRAEVGGMRVILGWMSTNACV